MNFQDYFYDNCVNIAGWIAKGMISCPEIWNGPDYRFNKDKPVKQLFSENIPGMEQEDNKKGIDFIFNKKEMISYKQTNSSPCLSIPKQIGKGFTKGSVIVTNHLGENRGFSEIDFDYLLACYGDKKAEKIRIFMTLISKYDILKNSEEVKLERKRDQTKLIWRQKTNLDPFKLKICDIAYKANLSGINQWPKRNRLEIRRLYNQVTTGTPILIC